MSDTATRLDAYKAAELRILKAQRTGFGDRSMQLAELEEVRKAIKDLEAQLAQELRDAAGQRGQSVMVADFSKGLS